MAEFKWHSGHHVDSYLADLAEIRSAYHSAGVTISNEDIFVKMLSCLPVEFDYQRQVMSQWTNYDLEAARKLLIERQNLLLKRKRGEDTTPIFSEGTVFTMTANHKQEGGLKNHNKRRKTTITCYYCHKKGHISPECRSRIADEKKGIFKKRMNANSSSTSSSSSSSSSSSTSAPTSSHSTPSASVHVATIAPEPSDGFSFLSASLLNDDNSGFCFVLGDITSHGKWILDSAATHHITADDSILNKKMGCEMKILTGKSGEGMILSNKGTVVFTALNQDLHQSVTLTDVFQNGDVACNIISIPQLTKKGCQVSILQNTLVVTFKGKTVFIATQEPSGLFVLSSHHVVVKGFSASMREANTESL